MSLNPNPNRVTTTETEVVSDSPPKNYRNWSELPRDITLIILMKLSAVEILESAQFVCKMWYILCKEPLMWRAIYIENFKNEKMMFNAIDRSDGSLIDLNIEGSASDELCLFFASRSSQLKRLRLACCDDISDKVFIEALESMSSLEELELTLCDFQAEVAVPIINSCPLLTTFKFNQLGSKCPDTACDDEALAIAGNMPELRHLQLIGNSLTDVGLTAILDGCPHLQSLDLRACFHIELVGNLGKRLLEQIKDFRRPYDSTDYYNYRTRFYNSSDSSDDYYTYESDYVKRLMSLMSDDDLESELDYFY